MAATRCACGRLLVASTSRSAPRTTNFFDLARRSVSTSTAASEPAAVPKASASASPAAPRPRSPPRSSPPPPKVVSSVKAGTPLKGIRIIKGVEDPVAKEDSEYPEWLWSLADPDLGVGKNDSPIRAMRRSLNKQNVQAIRASNFLKDKRK